MKYFLRVVLVSHDEMDEQKLIGDLLRYYNRMARPVNALGNYTGGGEQVLVTITLMLSLVDSLVGLDLFLHELVCFQHV